MVELADLDLFGGGDKAEPSYESLYADGLKAGADVAWQVAAFRVTPAYATNKIPGGKTYTNQPVEEAVSELWLFNLPAAFTGLTCGGTVSRESLEFVLCRQQNGGRARSESRAEQLPLPTPISLVICSSSRARSPSKNRLYASHVAAGNSVKIEDLFIDWGDGSSAVPVIGKLEGGGAWSKEKKITLNWGLVAEPPLPDRGDPYHTPLPAFGRRHPSAQNRFLCRPGRGGDAAATGQTTPT